MTSSGTLFGYAVSSVFEHESLSSAPARRGTIEIGRRETVPLEAARVTHHHDGGGSDGLTIARDADGRILLDCSGAGGFQLDAGALRVLADRREGSDDLWEHRLVTVVIPLLLADRGDVAIHAAGIAHRGRAVAFAGASTRGKSTLALAAAESGLGVLADDGVVLERRDGGDAIVWPGPASARVARAGRPRKETVAFASGPLLPVPLAAIAVLGPLADDGPVLERVPPTQAVPVLVPSLVFSGTDTVQHALRDAAWLASTFPIFRCRMPQGIERLPAALVEVLERIVSAEDA
ncbi:MAG: hypothetical protein LH654_05725 [Thermoleophilia bacterium]|nr:hypothetical protein [Thermoleophilia bacterium]